MTLHRAEYSLNMWFGPQHWPSTRGLPSVSPFFFSSLELQPCAPSIYLSHSLWVFFSSLGSFSVFHRPSFPLSLFSLSALIFYSTLASVFFKQLVFGSAPSSNIQYILKELRSHVFVLKPLSYLCPALPLSLPLSISLPLFLSLHPALKNISSNQNVVC